MVGVQCTWDECVCIRNINTVSVTLLLIFERLFNKFKYIFWRCYFSWTSRIWIIWNLNAQRRKQTHTSIFTTNLDQYIIIILFIHISQNCRSILTKQCNHGDTLLHIYKYVIKYIRDLEVFSWHIIVTCEDMKIIQFAVKFPANMRRWTNVGLMLAQRLRRWPNIKPTLVQRPILLG